MLIAITLTLQPTEDVLLAPHLGRAAYAAVLRQIRQADPALAESIHSSDGIKPLTCSGILNAHANREGTQLRAGLSYYMRVTGLSSAVSEALDAVLVAAPPPTWELERVQLPVAAVTCDEAADPWSGRAAYESLAAAHLVGQQQASRTVSLQFTTPTSFKSQGMTVPVPLPGLVFGSLVERWNAYSSVGLSQEMRRYAEERIAISQYQLRTRPVPQKRGALRIGAVGQATYRSLGSDRYWIGLMQLLADFARFGGVGSQTTTGMGQVRRLGRA